MTPQQQHACGWCKADVQAGTSLCARCTKTLRHAIENTGAYFADLETLRTHAKGIDYRRVGGGKGGKKSQPLGMDIRFAPTAYARDEQGELVLDRQGKRIHVSGQATEVEKVVRGIVATWGTAAVATWPELRHPADNIPSVCTFLASIVTAIAAKPWAAGMIRDFRTAERKLRGLVDTAPPRWYAGKCSAPLDDTDEASTTNECQVDLYARTQTGNITCPGCGATHDIASRREVLLAEAEDVLVTATEAAAALLAWTDYNGSETKLVDRIRKWRDREKLDVQDVTSLQGRDRHLYRLGDIRLLLVDDAQHAQSRRIGAA